MPLLHERNPVRNALRGAIEKEIALHGPACSLNHLDISKVTDMSALFENLLFQGDISQWDVSHVVCMAWMFKNTTFSGDISKWNTARLVDASGMFMNSRFDGDLSNWNVRRLRYAGYMFAHSVFNGDISRWKSHYLQQTFCMFLDSKFNQPLSGWETHKMSVMDSMFQRSAFNQDLSSWVLHPTASLDWLFAESPFQGLLPQITPQETFAQTPILPPTYRGDFQNRYSLEQAKLFFGNLKKVDLYLNDRLAQGHPMDRLHVERMMVLSRCPRWSNKAMFSALKVQQRMFEQLGCTAEQISDWLTRDCLRQQEGQPAQVDSIDFSYDSI